MKRDRLLAIDIGNTTVSAGLFRGPALRRVMRMETGRPRSFERRLRSFLKAGGASGGIDRAIIASVVPGAVPPIRRALRAITRCRIDTVGKTIRVPIENRYRNKAEVGQDRLVNAYAAAALYGTPAVVIDFGTAITFDVVGRGGAYLGGLIMPGIGISLASLYERTALLPKVTLREARDIIAKDTVGSMRGGILFGFGAMCDGLIIRYRQILGKGLTVIATGGNASLVVKHTRSAMRVDGDLTLKGIALLINQKAI